MDTTQLYILAAIAGGTIFLGLPLAFFPGVDARVKGFLNALSVGVIVFLLIEIAAKVLQAVEVDVMAANLGKISLGAALTTIGLGIGGFAVGLLCMVAFERRYIRAVKAATGSGEADPKHLAMVIAVAIGLHNLSEGLAIGQMYASGFLSLAIMLIVGFGLHNATEGFGIAAPLSGARPSPGFVLLLGLIGGGPTFLGTIIGSAYTSPGTANLCLGLSAGALLYILFELIPLMRRIAPESQPLMMTGLLVGFCISFGSELVIENSSNAVEAAEHAVAYPVPARGPSAAAGKPLFEANCASCHGNGGEGDGPTAATLPKKPPSFKDYAWAAGESDGALYDIITYGMLGTTRMPAWKDKLSDEQRWDLVAYIRQFAYSKGPVSAAAAPKPHPLAKARPGHGAR